jgi:hypothetical protein
MSQHSLPRPIVHLYALCWNEEKMLPFFFDHHDPFVDAYFIADHGSTDHSRQLLDAHPRVVTTDFACSEASFVESAREHYNRCWKASRGVADWVIICNVDEHLHHPDLLSYLAQQKSEGTTLIVPRGYNMVSKAFPDPHLSLKSQVRFGAREPLWDKPQIFNPSGIEEIHFAVGRHTAQPSGLVKMENRGKVQLLHYKYLGTDYLLSRSIQLGARMRKSDLVQGWGRHYADLGDWTRAQREIRLTRWCAVPVYSPLKSLFVHAWVLRQSVRWMRWIQVIFNKHILNSDARKS